MKQTVKATVRRCERFGAVRVYSYTPPLVKALTKAPTRRVGVILV